MTFLFYTQIFFDITDLVNIKSSISYKHKHDIQVPQKLSLSRDLILYLICRTTAPMIR